MTDGCTMTIHVKYKCYRLGNSIEIRIFSVTRAVYLHINYNHLNYIQ